MKVNGPVNVVRLEGTINNIKKVIYLFMDIHSYPKNQTECNSIRSIDIKEYLIKQFDSISNNDKTYDFLFEIKPTNMHKKDNRRGRYIDQIVKLFKMEYDINKDITISESNSFPNVRLHIVDIRDYLKYNQSKMVYSLLDFLNIIWTKFSISDTELYQIKSSIKLITDRTKLLYNNLYNNKRNHNKKMKRIIPKNLSDLSKYTEQDYNKRVIDIFHKLQSKYKNKKVQSSINIFLNKNVKVSFNYLFESSKKLIDKIDQVIKSMKRQGNNIYHDKQFGVYYGYPPFKVREMILDIYNMFEVYYIRWMNLNSDIMDSYFLRRFLDKDYITNAIAYTGIYHSINYIHVLVKYFNFDITNYSYMKIDPKKAKSIIKDSNTSIEIQDIFYPKEIIQCSDLTNFPNNFE
jgi:hypothetical protein